MIFEAFRSSSRYSALTFCFAFGFPLVHEILKSRDFTSFDEVFCVGHSADWATEWLVIDAELAFVNLQLQKVYEFEQQHVSDENRMPAGFSILRDRIHGQYYAVRDVDGHEFLSGFNRREDCLRALLDHAIFRTEG